MAVHDARDGHEWRTINRRQITRRTVSKRDEVLCGILVKRLVIQPVNEFTDAAAALMSAAWDHGSCGLANLGEQGRGQPRLPRHRAFDGGKVVPRQSRWADRRNGVLHSDRAQGHDPA